VPGAAPPGVPGASESILEGVDNSLPDSELFSELPEPDVSPGRFSDRGESFRSSFFFTEGAVDSPSGVPLPIRSIAYANVVIPKLSTAVSAICVKTVFIEGLLGWMIIFRTNYLKREPRNPPRLYYVYYEIAGIKTILRLRYGAAKEEIS
jgi:hypothetical protein